MHSLAVRVLAVPVVAGVTIIGIWVSGALISNDFAVSMWLTVGWMALTAAIVLGVAVRSRALRRPALIGYAVAALAAGVYLGPSALFDDVVDEQVATAAPAPSLDNATPRNVLLRSGRFQSVRHGARGEAQLIRLANGRRRVLALTHFDVANGPDLRIYLVAGPARTEDDIGDVVDLGALKGNKGDQQYRIPAGTSVDEHSTVVIWCRAFSVLFARARLDR